jgi:iron complex transport system ATP-binding protein
MQQGGALCVNDLSLEVNHQDILKGIDFVLPEGALLGVLGPNGAGKTSLLRCLSAQLACKGELLWLGQSLTSFTLGERARQIAVLHQHNSPIFALTAQQIVAMGLLPNKALLERQTQLDRDKINLAMQRVGLSHKADQSFNTLSGGEQQRCLLARTLLQGASLMLMDEPINHLDLHYQHQIMQMLVSMKNSNNKTVVVSLHDVNLAANYCDFLLLLNNGEQYAFGRPQDILRPNILSDVFRLPCEIVTMQSGQYQVVFSSSTAYHYGGGGR